MNYGKGSAAGVLSKETVTIGDQLVHNQDFILVESDEDMDGTKADGILGMAFSKLSDGHETLVSNMVKSKVISEPIFSVYIGDNDYDRKKEKLSSNVIFGGHDIKKYSNSKDFTYIDLIKTGYWSVKLDKAAVDGTNINLKSNIAILDTGTSLIHGPSKEVSEIFKIIKKSSKDCNQDSGLLACTCSDVGEFPTIEFWLDDNVFYINPEEYLLKDGNTCLVLITGAKFQFWILGDVFLRSYYTIYDMKNEKVGIARSGSASSSKNNLKVFRTLMIILLITIIFVAFAVIGRHFWLKRRNSQGISSEASIPLVNFN